MNYTHYDLGSKSQGDIIEIILTGNAANVRLMDSSNYQSYRSGGQHKYYGGLARESPVRLLVPHSAHWHVTVDLQGLGDQPVRLSEFFQDSYH